MKIKSIKTRLLILLVIFTVFFTGLTNHFISNFLLEKYDEMVYLRNQEIVRTVLAEFEAERNNIEASLDTVTIFVLNELLEDNIIDERELDEIELKLDSMFRMHVSGENNFSHSVYVYFNPELDGRVHDVWIHERDGNVVREEEIPLERYIANDNMDWFYGPQESRTSEWIDPYTNRFDQLVTSYVVPIYKDDIFVGIAGMYLDLSEISDRLSVITHFEDDHFWVYDDNNNVVYHYKNKPGTSIEELEEENDDSSFTTYKSGTFDGWTFAYSIPKQVLNKSRFQVVFIVFSIFFTTLALISIFVLRVSTSYTKLFSRIMSGLKEMEEGDLSFQIEHNLEDEIGQMIDAINDSTNEQMKNQKRLYDIAHYHSVTGLPNRNKFNQDLKDTFEDNEFLSMSYINIDQFRVINDLIGYSKGDEFIKLISKIFIKHIGNLKMYHLSIDEFIVVSYHRQSLEQLIDISKSILSEFGTTLNFHNHHFFVTVSIGIVSKSSDLEKLEDFLRASDLAMVEARQQGRNNYQVYDREMYDHLIGLTSLERDFYLGLENDEFLVHYQPKVNLRDYSVTSVEALVRWNHPSKGIVIPDDFIEYAETSGLVVDLGYIVLHKVLRQLKVWLDQSCDIRVAVNLSIKQIMTEDFVDQVIKMLHDYQIEPSRLEFEITESLFIQDEEIVKSRMEVMSEYGIRFSLDDFGSGYSSLHVMNELQIDTLKIDKGLIQKCIQNRNTYIMVETVTQMAHKLGLEVVAEGVESKYELEVIKEVGIDVIQGYYFSRPVEASNITEVILRIKESE